MHTVGHQQHVRQRTLGCPMTHMDGGAKPVRSCWLKCPAVFTIYMQECLSTNYAQPTKQQTGYIFD